MQAQTLKAGFPSLSGSGLSLLRPFFLQFYRFDFIPESDTEITVLLNSQPDCRRHIPFAHLHQDLLRKLRKDCAAHDVVDISGPGLHLGTAVRYTLHHLIGRSEEHTSE